jgi:hypothetical protein
MVPRASLAVPVADVAHDALAARPMARVVGVGDGESLGDSKLRLDQTEPRGLGRRVDRRDAQPVEEAEEAGMVVHVGEVIEDDGGAQVRPPMGLTSSGPHSSKQTTAARGGQRR